MNYYDVIFAQQKAKKDSKYFDEISDAINVLAGTETTYTPSEMAPAIIDAIPTETASGNPIHITDAANFPAESVVTTLEPVQDLHGYDKPWPAGGGKNLLDTSTVTISNITFTQGSNGYITASPNTEDSRIWSYSSSQYKVTLPAGLYKLVAEVQTPTTASSQGIVIFDSLSHTIVQEQSLFSTEGIKTINFELSENSDIGVMAKIYEGIVRFMICKQTVTDDIFEPYSNECPISGHTGVELTRTGKNLLDRSLIAPQTVSVNTRLRCNLFDIRMRIGNSYTISFLGNNIEAVLALSNESQPPSDLGRYPSIIEGSNSGWQSSGYVYTAGADGWVTIGFRKNDNSVITPNDIINVQLELGSTATTYEPYTPETHTTTFPQTQSPVYGCEVDWTEGVLRVTDVSATYDGSTDENWSNRTAGSANLFEISISDMNIPQSTLQIGKCNLFPWLITIATDKTYRLMGAILAVHYDGITLTEWKNMLAETPLQITYPLPTPLEIPLTPSLITLLKGENNVWTDAGTSEIEYKVDLQGYIQKLIDEASAQASTLSVSPLSLGKSAAVLTDGEDGGEIKDVESVDEADEVEGELAEDKKADEPAEESEKAEDLTVKKEIAEELAETEKVEKVKETEDIKETEEHESEVEE